MTPASGKNWTASTVIGRRGCQGDAPGCCGAARGPSVGWGSLGGCLSGAGAGAERNLGCCVPLGASVQTALHKTVTPQSQNSASSYRHFSTCVNILKAAGALEGVDHGGIRKEAGRGISKGT